MMMKVNPQARQPPSMPNFRYTHLTAENGMSRIKVISSFHLDLLPHCLILVTLLPSGHLATLCGRQSRIPLLCAIQVSLLIWKESWWYHLQSKIIIKPSKKATTELRDVPNPPFLTNGQRLDHYHNKGSGKCLSQSKRVSSRKITNNVDADSVVEIIYN